MGGVQLARRRRAPHPAAQIGGVIAGQFAGHQGRGVRIGLQAQHGLARLVAIDAITTVRALGDQVGVAGVAIFRPVLLQRREPRLIHELEETRGRGGPGLGDRVEAALALGRAHQEREVDPRRAGGALDRRLDDAADGTDGGHGPQESAIMVNRRLTTFPKPRRRAPCRTHSYKRKTNRLPDYDCQFTGRRPRADLILRL